MTGKNIKFLEKSLVKLNFSKKLMTPYGGVALLAKLFEKLELKEHIEKIFLSNLQGHVNDRRLRRV